jgi:hypothetical protein
MAATAAVAAVEAAHKLEVWVFYRMEKMAEMALLMLDNRVEAVEAEALLEETVLLGQPEEMAVQVRLSLLQEHPSLLLVAVVVDVQVELLELAEVVVVGQELRTTRPLEMGLLIQVAAVVVADLLRVMAPTAAQAAAAS